MTEAQGRNISEWQAQQQHQENQRGKSGFGLGHGDSVATIVDGMKWLFNFHEGAISAYSNIFEGLISGNSLVPLFGKSGNMFGIKFLENLSEYFSSTGSSEDIFSGRDAAAGPYSDDYPLTSKEIARSAEGLHDIHDAGDHHGQAFLQGPSPSFGDDPRYELNW